MIPKPSSLTWKSLYEYIERRIAGALEALELIKREASTNGSAHMSTSLEHQLEILQWCLPLVKEIQSHEDLQVICPIMSLELIRLGCRSQDKQDRSSDFAWITPVGSERYNLVRLGQKQSETAEILWSYEGGISEIIEKVKTLIREICV